MRRYRVRGWHFTGVDGRDIVRSFPSYSIKGVVFSHYFPLKTYGTLLLILLSTKERS